MSIHIHTIREGITLKTFSGSKIYIYQGGEKTIKTINAASKYWRYRGCAVLHPQDDNILYVFGGKKFDTSTTVESAFKVDLENDQYEDIREMGDTIFEHTCQSFIDPQTSKPVRFCIIVGSTLAVYCESTKLQWPCTKCSRPQFCTIIEVEKSHLYLPSQA